MKKFLIAEAEKARILGMHYNAMGKSLVSEQDVPWTEEIMNNTGLRSIGSMEDEYMEYGQFEVTFTTETGGRTTYAYQCITDPREKEGEGFKAGTVRDYDENKLVNPNQIGLKGDWLNYIKKWCKPGYDWLAKWNAKNAPKTQAPTPQVASAQVKGGVSPETQKQIDNAIRSGFMTKTVDPTTKSVKYISTGKGSFTIGSMNINLAKGQDITRMVIQ
jgi:hypothetical protein